jgi:preprotein translocase subunit SecF
MKIIRFSRAFMVTAILSLVLILSGLIPLLTKGLNLGLDFAPGLLEEIRIAPTALELTYDGAARAVVAIDSGTLQVVVSGAGEDNATYGFPFADHATLDSLAAALNNLAGVGAALAAPGSTASAALFADSSVSTVLGSAPYRFHYNDGTAAVTVEAVRAALSGIADVAVKPVGATGDNAFQVRIAESNLPPAGPPSAAPAAEGDADAGAAEAAPVAEAAPALEAPRSTIQEQVSAALKAAFGDDTVAVITADFVGAQFSRSLAFKSIWVVLATLVLIWVYSTIRFKWDFALGAVLAVVHDSLIMFAFIAWTQIEFSTIVLAAILTIIGYSINGTIVALDRVRENTKADSSAAITVTLDRAQTEILSRTIITACTTMLAALALMLFTTGSMRNFAQCLMAGLVSGVYSSIFIVGSVITALRRKRPAVAKK